MHRDAKYEDTFITFLTICSENVIVEECVIVNTIANPCVIDI